MSEHLPAFRLGDIRGIYPEDIDFDFVVAFAHAFVEQFQIKGSVAVGRDMRGSSVILQDGLQQGLVASGVHVVNLGLCTTELGYFASSMPEISAAIIVTASHNPSNYNGLKCVLSGGAGVHFENGLDRVMKLMINGHLNRPSQKGTVSSRDYHATYIEFLRGRFRIDKSSLGTIALNGLNGTASTLAADIAYEVDLSTRWYRKEPGPIPPEGADPANPKLRQQMSHFMQSERFSLGVAWDGDCDRCVFFDGSGRYIPSYYMVGLLADHVLQETGPAPVVYDTKLCWNILDVIRKHDGATPVPSRTGHSFMKENMKRSSAVYGGELSSHHYFGDFFSCDSGMYAWLKVVEMICHADESLEEMVVKRRQVFSCCGEMTLKLTDVDLALVELRKRYSKTAQLIEVDDGLAFDMGDWRFSIRESKTEPCVRLNLESRGSGSILLEQGETVLSALEPFRDEERSWLEDLRIE